MSGIFQFGEEIGQYDFRVINERDARASAGIMFLLGSISFFSFILTKNLFWAELFSVTFIMEFFVRVLINPIYAPYMILGSFAVSNQQPEWVEAKPKKFAWILGAILGAIMTYFILGHILNPARLMICILCLVLLFLESSLGICLGCILYKKLNQKLYICPGGVCDKIHTIQNKKSKFLIFGIFLVFFYLSYYILKEYRYETTKQELQSSSLLDKKQINTDCVPPQWAIDMGHKEIWLEHHGCK